MKEWASPRILVSGRRGTGKKLRPLAELGPLLLLGLIKQLPEEKKPVLVQGFNSRFKEEVLQR